MHRGWVAGGSSNGLKGGMGKIRDFEPSRRRACGSGIGWVKQAALRGMIASAV